MYSAEAPIAQPELASEIAFFNRIRQQAIESGELNPDEGPPQQVITGNLYVSNAQIAENIRLAEESRKAYLAQLEEEKKLQARLANSLEARNLYEGQQLIARDRQLRSQNPNFNPEIEYKNWSQWYLQKLNAGVYGREAKDYFQPFINLRLPRSDSSFTNPEGILHPRPDSKVLDPSTPIDVQYWVNKEPGKWDAYLRNPPANSLPVGPIKQDSSILYLALGVIGLVLLSR